MTTRLLTPRLRQYSRGWNTESLETSENLENFRLFSNILRYFNCLNMWKPQKVFDILVVLDISSIFNKGKPQRGPRHFDFFNHLDIGVLWLMTNGPKFPSVNLKI